MVCNTKRIQVKLPRHCHYSHRHHHRLQHQQINREHSCRPLHRHRDTHFLWVTVSKAANDADRPSLPSSSSSSSSSSSLSKITFD
ncbi:hypothetical protein TYRP_012270 [Tyrophagus putrescentiae]|nr:hypothetical protein TYRP_012270 [Tyrophagus putrescentiae]